MAHGNAPFMNLTHVNSGVCLKRLPIETTHSYEAADAPTFSSIDPVGVISLIHVRSGLCTWIGTALVCPVIFPSGITDTNSDHGRHQCWGGKYCSRAPSSGSIVYPWAHYAKISACIKIIPIRAKLSSV